MTAQKSARARERDNLRKRLKTTAGRVEAFADDLERTLTDRTGNAYWRHRLLGGLLCETHTLKRSPTSPNLPEQVERIKLEADGGCALSQRWLDQYGQLYELCIHLQREAPPKRAADYSPLEELSDYQIELLAQRHRWTGDF